MYKIVKRLIILTILVTTTIVILGNAIINLKAWNLLIEDLVSEKTSQINYFFDKESSDLQDIIESHAVWSESIINLNKADDDWLYQNIAGYIIDYKQFNIDYICLSNEANTFHRVYGIDLSHQTMNRSEFNQTLAENIPTQTIEWNNDKLYIVRLSPLYDDNFENPEGVYIIGRAIDSDSLQSLKKILHESNVTNISITKEPIFKSVKTKNFEFVDFSVQVHYGSDTFYVNLSFDIPIYKYLFETQQNHSRTVLILFSLITVLIALYFMKTISNTLVTSISVIKDISRGIYDEKLDLTKNKLMPELAQLELSVNTMSSVIQEKIEQLDQKYIQMINLIGTAMSINDLYTHQHNNDVSKYSMFLANLVGFHDIESVELAGMFHDIGKIATPYHILNKESKLSEEEFSVIKLHPIDGFKLLSDTDFNQLVKDGVLYHHEKYDGSGYPYGLSGNKIPLIAQILSIADVYDALTSDRPYRKSLSHEQASKILHDGKGKAFNPQLVDVFLDEIHLLLNDFKHITKQEIIDLSNKKGLYQK